jgi:hypothetical protein
MRTNSPLRGRFEARALLWDCCCVPRLASVLGGMPRDRKIDGSASERPASAYILQALCLARHEALAAPPAMEATHHSHAPARTTPTLRVSTDLANTVTHSSPPTSSCLSAPLHTPIRHAGRVLIRRRLVVSSWNSPPVLTNMSSSSETLRYHAASLSLSVRFAIFRAKRRWRERRRHHV